MFSYSFISLSFKMIQKKSSVPIDHIIDRAIIGVYYLWEVPEVLEDNALGYAQDQMYYVSDTK
jgi:hypothetical protein